VNPDIVFADEPTGNLDSATSKEMMDLMRKVVNEHKKTLVMVTHDDKLASYADRVIRIVDGKIVQHEVREDGVLKTISGEDKSNEET
jgi:putative ABC transport system ATP-binding protein